MLRSKGIQPKAGIALLLVLVFIVLIAALLFAFFSDATTEMAAAKTYSTSVSTRQLSETATNFVMAQIGDATAGLQDPGNPTSPILAWASQPGMIRTYRGDGEPHRYYKLYSARNMVSAPGSEFNVNNEFAEDTPANWSSNPATFTDLNAPLRTDSGRYEYPIMDPGAQKSGAGATDGVDGFELLKGPGFLGSDTRTPTDPLLTPNANPAMMPVRWIYVLRDGSLTAAPAPDADGVLKWSQVSDLKSRPSKENPIVGRIAFWTDDETAKVNINTACEGTFWDRPWGPSGVAQENDFATRIPAQGEYTRYAGHPAMTCLSPVLGFVMPYGTATEKRNYHFLVPRVQFGGTEAGSKVAANMVGQDNERLFASVDELAFSPILNGPTRTTWTTNSVTTISPERAVEVLSKARFFLTASSRAPDVNLFNKPRIGLWPLQLSNTERNAKDRYIAFCGTTLPETGGEARYYFQRQTSYATTAGTNDGVSKFISPMPSSCHPTMDWDNIPRNQELYGYLKDLTSREVPGFGASLRDKYDQGLPVGYSDRDQILTSMADFIRTEVNSYNTSSNLTPQYDYAPTRRGIPVAGETQLIPLKIRDVTTGGTTMGFGRFATITEVALVFQRFPVTPTEQYLRAHVVLEPFNPSPGCASWSPHVRYVIKGLENLRVNGEAFNNIVTDLGFAKPVNGVYPFNWTTARVGYAGGGHKLAYMGLGAAFRYFSKDPDPPKVYGTSGAVNEYPFHTMTGARITNLPPNANTTRLFGLAEDVNLEIQIYSGYESVAPGETLRPDLLVQTLHVTFPKVAGIPLPKEDTKTFNERLASTNANDVVKSTDSVRAVEIRSDGPAGGDLRYVSALADVPAQFFIENPKYRTSGQALAHSLRSAALSSPGYDSTRNPILVPSATYTAPPVAAAGLKAAVNVSGQGDFDNGTGSVADGCYINKADEGNLKTGAASYFDTGSFTVEDGITFSPNRQIASAVSFGSLPTGIKSTEYAVRNNQGAFAKPWQTLLFTATPSSRTGLINFNSPAGSGKHPGFPTTKSGSRNTPPYRIVPDHLWLDLFTMPVIEPYAISEPFSTAGRINLNYQIAPFTYIQRTTGLQAVLRSVKMAAIPTSSGDKSAIQRFDLNAAVGDSVSGGKLDGPVKGTLAGFQERFDAGDLFRSASQICDIPLIPKTTGVSYDTIDTFWNGTSATGGYKRTGDNLREIPYGQIYPRVTTKSNTFTVHMRVQALQKSANGDPMVWKEGVDKVVGEYRGSTTLERYIDASDPTLPDFANPANSNEILDRHYRFRIIGTKAFVR